ncbi:MAG: alpha/beta hydrolase [Betaproteobacteria bacterium]|nr:MAG: alpha/beta hydrolase [Betaproteobacteria bacterium]
MFEGFDAHDVTVNGVRLHARVGGGGPAILLLHGHPQTHAMWHAVAPVLADRFTVVTLDLRGYGDSDRPASDDTHAAYSKRTMAADALAVMRELGHARFAVCAHDRGARVAHRLALDHPDAVQRLLLLDIAPTHWFFLIQPAPLPERFINADPLAYLHDVIGRRHAGLAAFAPPALAEYERCIARPGTAHAICEDYRASASVDLDHDRADRAAGRKLVMPLRVLWGAHGAVGRCFDVLALWRDAAETVSGRALDCGHYIAEERPQELIGEMLDFFAQEQTP